MRNAERNLHLHRLVSLDRVRADPFDLVLLDVMMPEVNGYEALEILKGDPKLRHIPA